MSVRDSDASGPSLPLRLGVVCSPVVAVLAGHLAMRYLHVSLFGYVTYRGLPPVVPWVVLGASLLVLVALAGLAVRRWSGPGLALGAGLLLLAAEPFAILDGGCEVGAATGAASIVPRVVVDGVAVVVYSWNGACDAHLHGVVLTAGVLSVAGGLWFSSIPGTVLGR